jgi:hypothetical protein
MESGLIGTMTMHQNQKQGRGSTRCVEHRSCGTQVERAIVLNLAIDGYLATRHRNTHDYNGLTETIERLETSVRYNR